MKIVVTGALGHIGSHLIRLLPTSIPNAKIFLVDNLSTQRFASLFNLPDSGHYRFIEADIKSTEATSVIEESDVVVHLAAITDAANSFGREAEVESVNVAGTEHVARAAARGNSKLVFLSTTSVYGTQEKRVDENCSESELKPQSPYAESKLASERLLTSLRSELGLRHVALRFGTIFGTSPGMRFHTAVNKFVWLASQGKPVTVWRTALDQRRPYLDLDDGARAIAHVIHRDLFNGDVFNVVTANATVREIVDAIRAKIPDLGIDFVDTKIMNQLSYEVSAARFTDTGFSFRGDVEAGIANSVSVLRGIRSL